MTARPALALDPRRFGRRLIARSEIVQVAAGISDELRLFATTFAAGFVFVSVLIA
jgi:hypothetical protein